MDAIYYLSGLLATVALFLTILGFIKPSVFEKLLGKRAKRAFITLCGLGTIIVLGLVLGATEPESLKRARQESEQAAAAEQLNATQPMELEPEVSEQETIEPTPDPRFYWHQVTSVVDADTIKARVDGKEEVIRIIGIDAPESNECYSEESTAKAKELLQGKWVQLEVDGSQDNHDVYSRLLRYVWFGDGSQDFGAAMISDGYVYEYTYKIAYGHQADYKQTQQNAKNNSKGLWSNETCNGQRIKPAPKNTNTTPPPKPKVDTTPPAVQPKSDVYYANCTAARKAGAAPILRGEPGYRAPLDRDNDGVACE